MAFCDRVDVRRTVVREIARGGVGVAAARQLEEGVEAAFEVVHLAVGVDVDKCYECARVAELLVKEVGVVAGVSGLDGHRDAFPRHADDYEVDALGRAKAYAVFAVERQIAVVFVDNDLLGPYLIDVEWHEFEFALVFEFDVGKLEGREARLMVVHDVARYRAVDLCLAGSRLSGVIGAVACFDFEGCDVVGFLADDFADEIERLEVEGIVAGAVDVARLAEDEDFLS